MTCPSHGGVPIGLLKGVNVLRLSRKLSQTTRIRPPQGFPRSISVNLNLPPHIYCIIRSTGRPRLLNLEARPFPWAGAQPRRTANFPDLGDQPDTPSVCPAKRPRPPLPSTPPARRPLRHHRLIAAELCPSSAISSVAARRPIFQIWKLGPRRHPSAPPSAHSHPRHWNFPRAALRAAAG